MLNIISSQRLVSLCYIIPTWINLHSRKIQPEVMISLRGFMAIRCSYFPVERVIKGLHHHSHQFKFPCNCAGLLQVTWGNFILIMCDYFFYKWSIRLHISIVIVSVAEYVHLQSRCLSLSLSLYSMNRLASVFNWSSFLFLPICCPALNWL